MMKNKIQKALICLSIPMTTAIFADTSASTAMDNDRTLNLRGEVRQEPVATDAMSHSKPIVVATPVVVKDSKTNTVSGIERRLHADVDFLYWRTYTSNLPWVSTRNNTEVSHPVSLENIKYKFEPGVRLALGYRTGKWDDLLVNASWTRFHPSSSNYKNQKGQFGTSSAANNHSEMLPYWVDAARISDGPIFDGKANFKTDFDQLDVYIGKEFIPYKRFMLVPKAGLRSVWNKNDVSIELKRTEWGTTVVTNPPYNTDSQHLKSHLKSLGLLVGLDGDVDMGKGFHLFGGVSGALLSATTTVDQTASSMTPSGVSSKGWSKRDTQIKPMLDYNFGLAWVRNLSGAYAVGLKLAYESHILYGANPFMASLDDTYVNQMQSVNGNTSFQGLTLGASFAF